MRIAILTSGVLPVPAVQGGAVENLLDFCLAYNDKYALHDITVYSVSHPAIKKHPALKSKVNHYYYIDISGLWATIKKRYYLYKYGEKEYYHYSVEYFLNQALKHISKKKYDVILVENRPGYVLKIRGKTSAKIIIHQENDYLNKNMPFFQEIYDATFRIINTSDYITKQVKTINQNDSKCRTVLNGIDIQHFIETPALPRETVGLKKEDFVIVFSGRLTKEKGILELVQSMVLLSNIPNMKLLIVGASAYGPDVRPTSFITKLVNESQPVKNNIVFTGFIDYGQIPSYLKMADIAVLPSIWEEPFGLTIIEALAAGLPLITTRSGGIPEICEGVSIILDKNNLVENLAKVIHDLYSHPEKRDVLAKASLNRAKFFDKEIYANNIFANIDI